MTLFADAISDFRLNAFSMMMSKCDFSEYSLVSPQIGTTVGAAVHSGLALGWPVICTPSSHNDPRAARSSEFSV